MLASTGTITITCSIPAPRLTGLMLWANLHLLFWLSLFPFATGWMGENGFAAVPTAVYGFVLLMAGIAYLILQRAIIRAQGPDSLLKKAVGRDWKGKVSLVLYLAAIVVALLSPPSAEAVFVVVALLWLIPDRRIERYLGECPRLGCAGRAEVPVWLLRRGPTFRERSRRGSDRRANSRSHRTLHTN